MDFITPAIGLIFWMLVIFGVLVYILGKYAWKPIVTGLKEREQSIDSALKMAEETRAEMAKLKADNEKIMAQARADRDLIIREGKNAADKLIAEAKDKAVLEANKVMVAAKTAIDNERAGIVSQMKADVSKLSLEIAEKVLRRELAEKSTQQKLVSDLIAEAKLN